MAFETASTPVNAEHPELKAFSSRKRLTFETAVPISGTSGCAPPVAYLITPVTIRTTIDRTNRYTGIAMKEADSVTPRRLMIVRMMITVTAMATAWSCRLGKADVIASVPAEALTATVRM
ncbi:hypothetical protein D3C71_1870970 [compost metagenome]